MLSSFGKAAGAANRLFNFDDFGFGGSFGFFDFLRLSGQRFFYLRWSGSIFFTDTGGAEGGKSTSPMG